jgi:hypothetical protein
MREDTFGCRWLRDTGALAAKREHFLSKSENLNRILSATRHVDRGHEIVARQRRIIARLRAQSFDTAAAEELLTRIEGSLAMSEEELAALVKWG